MTKEPITKVCPICGQAFDTTNSRKIYCTPKCRDRANNGDPQTPSERLCAACGRQFVADHWMQKYCTTCRLESLRFSNRESARRLKGAVARENAWEKIISEGNLICRYCGKRYHGEPGTSCCPSCASIVTSNIRPRICRECGREFSGGPRAWYCPECRAERQRMQSREARERNLAGQTRHIGSEDICIVCGKPYIVSSGTQHYCPDCAKEAVAAIDRQQGRRYGREHNDERRERRKQAKAEILCVICKKPFIPKGKEFTCSDKCSQLLQKRNAAAAEARNRDYRNAYHRQRLADKIAAMSPTELEEYREKERARSRENYKKRKEKKKNDEQ